MAPEIKSLLDLLGLPGSFGGTLLGLCLVLMLAPYFSGLDFGIVKIPDFSLQWRRRLRWLGPISLLAIISMHVPFYTAEPVAEDEPVAGKDIVVPEPVPTDTLQSAPADSIQDDNSESEPPVPPDTEPSGQNEVHAEIVKNIISAVPKETEPIGTVSTGTKTTLVGLVTVRSRTPKFVPVNYYLEWLLVTPDGQRILLDSYRTNPEYKFTQRSDAQLTLYWVNKTIWPDNAGTYIFGVYTSDYQLATEARLEIKPQ